MKYIVHMDSSNTVIVAYIGLPLDLQWTEVILTTQCQLTTFDRTVIDCCAYWVLRGTLLTSLIAAGKRRNNQQCYWKLFSDHILHIASCNSTKHKTHCCQHLTLIISLSPVDFSWISLTAAPKQSTLVRTSFFVCKMGEAWYGDGDIPHTNEEPITSNES